MILFAETQIFLLIKPLRLDAGYKARIGAHGDIDVPGLERAHHLIAAERKGSVASVRRLEPCGRMQRRQNDEVGDVRSSDDELPLESVRWGCLPPFGQVTSPLQQLLNNPRDRKSVGWGK